MRAPSALIFLLGFTPVLLGACSAGRAAEKAPPPAGSGGGPGGGCNAPVPVPAAPVLQKPMPFEVQAIGSAEAYSNVAVHAQITGELTSVNFKEGDDVKQGQVLFTLVQRPLQ